MIDRKQALDVLYQHTKSLSLRRHALAVEAAMRGYARHYGEDEEAWGIAGLLHDFDYESHPSVDEHPVWGCRLLEQLGYPQEIIEAILGHANHTGVARTTKMAKVLFAVDELSGFLMAAAMVRPDRSIANVRIKSVKKKLKDKAFARGVNRDDIFQGVEELQVALDEHIEQVRDALAMISGELGLPES